MPAQRHAAAWQCQPARRTAVIDSRRLAVWLSDIWPPQPEMVLHSTMVPLIVWFKFSHRITQYCPGQHVALLSLYSCRVARRH